jgi:RNA polymerase sigma-70 factor (ECF subfamily)
VPNALLKDPAACRAAFSSALGEALRRELDQLSPEVVDAKLEELWQIAREPWPELALDEGPFFSALAHRLKVPKGALSAAAQLHLGDLYLACACAVRVDAALRIFERYLQEIDGVLLRRGHAADRIDEVKQQIRQKLFVPGPDGQGGKIAEYSGRGELKAWLRAIAVRTALNCARAESGPVVAMGDEPLLELIDHQQPELVFLKQQYRREFKAAFEVALASLTPRERLLLRQHAVDGLSADEIGALYGVHRVSAFRWLAQARTRLKMATRRQLRERLQVSPPELESILRLIESQLDVSLGTTSLRR